jgi:hypothetical protein
MAMARIEASGLWGDYGYDEQRKCWWASDSRDRHFVVEELKSAGIAA